MTKAIGEITRRTILKSGVAAAAIGTIYAPAVHAQVKEIRLLQDQTFVDLLRVIKEAAARYEQERGVRVVVDTVPSADLYPRILAGIRGGRPYDLTMIIFVAHMLSLANEGQLAPVLPWSTNTNGASESCFRSRASITIIHGRMRCAG